MKPAATNRGRKDRRVERTYQALLEALLELIAEKGYDRTTVQDVLDRSNVGRSTFYSHFYNKEDLLLHRMSAFHLDVEENNGRDIRVPDVTGLFKHVELHYELYLGIRDSEVLDSALAIARDDLMASFQRLFENWEAREPDGPDAQFMAQFLTGALLHLILWWLDQKMPELPDTMNRWFRELAERTLNP